eukprot:740253_1
MTRTVCGVPGSTASSTGTHGCIPGRQSTGSVSASNGNSSGGFTFGQFSTTQLSSTTPSKEATSFSAPDLNALERIFDAVGVADFATVQLQLLSLYQPDVLWLAAEKGYSELVSFLLRVIPEIDINKSGSGRHIHTSLSVAASNGHMGVVRVLLADPKVDMNAGSDLNRTPLHRAASNGHVEVVRALLVHPGIDVNVERAGSTQNETPLWVAASKGHVEVVRALLAHTKVDVNKSNCDKWTPLYSAACNGHVGVVCALLTHP